MDPQFAKDGGYASRKLWFSIFCVAACIFAGKWLALAAVGEVAMAIVMICSIYVAGNTVLKWKNASSMSTAEAEKVEDTEAKTEETKAESEAKAPDVK